MAANSFNAAHRAEPVRGRLKTVFTALRETVDAVVSYRMRLAASEAEHVRPRQPRGGQRLEKREMIAVHLTSPDFSRRQAPVRPAAAIDQEGARSGTSAANHPAAIAAHFQPLDPGVVNQAIPAFFIGRNKDGFWIARDANGQMGGIFLLKGSALSFAKRNSRAAGCATIFPSERFELDLENRGNPLVIHVGSLMRLTLRLRRRIASLVGKAKEALRRR